MCRSGLLRRPHGSELVIHRPQSMTAMVAPSAKLGSGRQPRRYSRIAHDHRGFSSPAGGDDRGGSRPPQRSLGPTPRAVRSCTAHMADRLQRPSLTYRWAPTSSAAICSAGCCLAPASRSRPGSWRSVSPCSAACSLVSSPATSGARRLRPLAVGRGDAGLSRGVASHRHHRHPRSLGRSRHGRYRHRHRSPTSRASPAASCCQRRSNSSSRLRG